jgi:hypothetical protein
LEAWLQKQPREVSVAFAARAALRVLPSVWTARDEGFKGDFFIDIVLPVFRASAAAWVTARYPGQQMSLLWVNAAGAAAVGSAGRPAATFAVTAATSAATAAASPTPDAATAAAATAAAAAHAAYGTGPSFGLNLHRAAAPLWSAVSNDATCVEEGVAASVIAGSMLWPLHILQPEPLQSLWQEMKAALLAAKQDWQVWTIWFDDRVASYVRDEERELAYVRIEEALWDTPRSKGGSRSLSLHSMASYRERPVSRAQLVV